MSYDSLKPANDGFLAEFPPEMREQLRAIINDQIVDALKLCGLSPGNASGNIPISNGVVNVGLNAEKVGGNSPSAFAPANYMPPAVTGSSNGVMINTDKTKLDGISSGAEVNQMAFSNVLVGSTTIQADSKTDTLEIVAGTNIVITPDATNDRLTIAVTGTVSSATTAGSCTGNSATATTATTTTGNAGTATKLATGRTIALSGKITGTATSFDGSANISIPVTAVTADSCTGNSATATTASNATTAGGLAINTTGVNNVANQIVRTDANGYIKGSYFNTTAADTATAATSYFVETGGDGYMRPKALANVKAELGITALESNLIKEVVLAVASSDISATSLGMIAGEIYDFTLTIPTSAVIAYINLYADGDTARANYSAWLETVGNGVGVAYVGYKAANTHTIMEGSFQFVASGTVMMIGRCYRSNGFLVQSAWNPNAAKSTIGTLLFRCTDSGLSTTVVGFPIGTTLRIYKKK